MKKAHALIFDGYADWELGNVLAELSRIGNVEVATIGFSGDVVVSMGGLHVTPDKVLADMDLDDVLIFIVPGGYMWEGTYPKAEIEKVLYLLEKAEIPIAAICAATTVVARAGILKDREHTSNSLEYMSKMVPDYDGHGNYVNSLAVCDRHIITASGLGSVDFTREVLDELNLGTIKSRSIWYDAFKHGKYPDNVQH